MTRADHEQEGERHPVGHSRLRSVLALVLLGIVAAGCFSLGLWQTGRAAERDALRNTIEQGRQQPPMALSASSQPADLMPWRPASAQGRWLPQYTVLLENRNLDGRPGYWVATPLQLESTQAETTAPNPAASSAPADSPAVLVLRGWLPRNMGNGGALPAIPQETGEVRVNGELHSHVPRIFELWQWAGGKSSQLPAMLPQADGGVPQVQNLALGDYMQSTGLRLLPIVLAQTQDTLMQASDGPSPGPAQDNGSAASPSSGGHEALAHGNGPIAGTATHELQREWPGPSLDSDQNRGYALQWFSFSAIAAIAALFVARGLLRSSPLSGKQ